MIFDFLLHCLVLLFVHTCSKDLYKEDLSDESVSFAYNMMQKQSNLRRLMQQSVFDDSENIKMSTYGCVPGIDVQCSDGTSDTSCDDTPPDTTFSCKNYLDLGLCPSLEDQYCKQSCGKCECVDNPVPGIECNEVVSQGICNDDAIKGIFCTKSCGFCGDNILASTVEDCFLGEALQCDADALLAFKKSITRGTSLLASWQGTNPCRNWDYVVCDTVEGSYERVVQVNMGFSGKGNSDAYTLSASLVPEISKIRFVSEFSLSSQNVTGQLFEEYSILDKLKKFMAYRLELSGSLSSTYSTWTNLEEFSTSFNQFESTLPKEYSQWQNLEYLYVGVNKLYGTLPEEFSSWARLQVIDVANNKLTGILPATFSTWQQVTEFDLEANDFSGTLPAAFSTWQQVTEFDLKTNDFSAFLPAEYSVMTSMEYFDASENKLLTGVAPPQWSAWDSCKFYSDFQCMLPEDSSLMSTLMELNDTLSQMLYSRYP